MDELLEKVNALGKNVIFLGDGVQVSYSFAPAHLNRQRAGAVAALGAVYFARGKTETAAEHQPDYLRVSQAERERAERLAKEHA